MPKHKKDCWKEQPLTSLVNVLTCMIDFVVAVYYYKYYKWSQTTALTHTQTNKQ